MDGADAKLEHVRGLVSQVPVGRVASYSEIGLNLEPPVSGFLVGRIMRRVGANVPWWRIVAQTGKLPVSKLSPNLASDQRERLEQEGVKFCDNGLVAVTEFWQFSGLD